MLNHKKLKYPEQRSISGRLLYWDHLQAQLSYLLCPPEEEDGSQESTVQREALPVLAPPETPEPKATFGTPLRNENPGHPVDLDIGDMIVPGEKPEKEEEDIDVEVTAAFLNADLPPGRVVVLRPPTVLYKLGLIPTGFVWRVHRAVYGLREAPSLGSQDRTKVMETMTFRSRGESCRVLISEIHRSISLLVREQDVLNSPQLTYAGLKRRVQRKDGMALCGI